MKNNPFTRFLSVALTVAMLIGVMPGAVLADAGEAIVGASSAVVESIPESTTPEDAAPVATEVPPVTEPEATPEATQEPEATPEATEEPEATPEATQEPEATPEATEEPEATPEATEEPEATPEPTQEPVELNEKAYTVTAEVADAEGVTVTVKVPANTLPEGVNLVAEMLTEDTQAHADAEAALAEAEVQYDGMIAMDIRFEDAQGNEVEPANEVEVSIDAQALLPEDADPETVAVQHLKEDETGAVSVETVADTDAATGDVTVAENADQAALNMASTFAVDGFSSFTITWERSSRSVEVYYVDTDGNPIDGTQIDDADFDNREWVDLNVYAGDIEGYTFVEYRYGSNFSNSDRMAYADESPQIRYYYSYYYYRTNDYGEGNRISWNGYYRNIYLVYEADSQSGGETGVTSATVTTGKTLILQDGQQAGSLYDLTLSVSGDRGSTEQKAMMDVLFIVDSSGSMAGSRLSNVKTAIKTISDNLSKNSNLSTRYAAVKFSGSTYDGAYNDASTVQGWTSNVTTFQTNVNAIGATGGTNYEAGLMKGKDVLSSAREGAVTVVIFLSDGKPGYYYDNDGNTTGSGSSYNGTAQSRAVAQCNTLDVDYFYTIGVGNEDSLDVSMKALADAALLVPSSNRGYYMANDLTALTDVFNKIESSITFYACSDVTITDPLSAYAELAENAQYTVKVTKTDESGNTTTVKEETVPSGQGVTFNSGTGAPITLTPSYDDQTRTITLDFPDTYELEEGYTYSVTTTVQPTQTATAAGSDGYNGRGDTGTGTHAGQGGFFSNNNESAQVTFRPTVNDLPGEVQYEPFPKPVIQVFDPGDVEMETPAHTKQAIQNPDGTYDLTLTVSGSTGTATKKAEVDVLMVVDVSNSMTDGGSPRLDNAKAAMNALVTELEGNDTVDARYSIVKFSSKNNSFDGNGTAEDAKLVLDWNGTKTEVENGIESLYSSGGTNYQAGLRLTATQLETARSTATTVVVFLSDGNPTYYIGGGNGSSTISGEGWNSTVNEAKTITCSQFYSVSIGKEQAAKMTEISNAVNASIHDSIAVQSDASDLTSKFQDIAGSVTALLCEDVTITDTLSQYAEAVIGADGEPEKLEVKVTDANGKNVTDTEVEDGGIVASYDADTKTVKLDFNENYQLKANYTYSVTLQIKPTEEALTYLAANSGVYPNTPDDNTGTHAPLGGTKEDGFYSNDEATLTYKITGINQNYTVDYDKPVIQVSKGNLLITKTFTGLSDTEIEALEDTLSFTYTNTADSSDSNTVTLGQMTKQSDGTYQCLVQNLDVNAQYKVTESRYEVADYDRTGSDLEVTVTIPSGQTVNADFTNNYTWNPQGSLTINKTLTSFNASMGDDATFQFRIEATSGKYEGRVWYRYVTYEDKTTGEKSVTITGLPEGTYKVTELDSAGYELYETSNDQEITISVGGSGTASFKNKSTGGNIPGDQDIVRNNFKYISGRGWVFTQQP